MTTESRPAQSRFLDLRALSAVAHRRFTGLLRAEGPYSGRHKSRRSGGAGEFADYREYTAGEDLRRLDWKVLARTGRAYTRVFQDETNLSGILVIDASGSMGYGAKLEYVQFVTTALSQILFWQQDQVALAVVSAGLDSWLPPGGAADHVLSVQAAIERLRPAGECRLDVGLRDLLGRMTRRGVLVIASDFLVEDPEPVAAAVRVFRQRQCEVIGLHVVHPDEERLPDGASFRFTDMEGGTGSVDCSPAEIRDAYRREFEAFAGQVRTRLAAAGASYHRVSTATPYLTTVQRLLRE